jgi:hypothetical protein
MPKTNNDRPLTLHLVQHDLDRLEAIRRTFDPTSENSRFLKDSRHHIAITAFRIGLDMLEGNNKE